MKGENLFDTMKSYKIKEKGKGNFNQQFVYNHRYIIYKQFHITTNFNYLYVPKKAFIVNLYFHFTENSLQIFTKSMHKVILMNKYINNVEQI